MKDMLGQDLSVGDKVIYMKTGYGVYYRIISVITEFTPKKVRIDRGDRITLVESRNLLNIEKLDIPHATGFHC